MTTDARIRLRTLGNIGLTRPDGSDITAVLSQPKRLALVVYLAVANDGGLCRRDTVLGIFWPEFDQDRARAALRKALHFLRRELGDGVIVTRGDEEVGVDPGRLNCDALDFTAAAGSEERKRALGLYQGEFLDGFHVSDAVEFERWRDETAARLRRDAVHAAERVTRDAMAAGEPHAAARAAHTWTRLAPYDEDAGRTLMAALDAAGDRTGALQAYEALERRLRDLEVEPSAETRELAEAIRNRHIGGAGSRSKGDKIFTGARRGYPLRVRASVLVTAVLVAIVGAAMVLRSPSQTLSDPTVIDAATSGVAVLPFRVSPGLELWREGMVDVLSAKLDGVGGLRGIHPGTVMVRWHDAVGGQDDADLSTMLEIATRTGARWLINGSAITTGKRLSFTARLHDVQSASPVGAAIEVAGSADSILSLTDQLTVGIVQRLLGDQGLAAARMEEPPIFMTSSVAAMRAYLEGEALFRHREGERAEAAYERAVAIDTSFALGHVRLAQVRGFGGGGPDVERALRSLDRVSEREAVKVRGTASIIRKTLDQQAALEQATRIYPDDADIWSLLGDMYFHSEGESMVSLGEMRRVLRRAVELQSPVPPYGHLVQATINAGDSAATFDILSEWAGESATNRRGYWIHKGLADLVFRGARDRDTVDLLGAFNTAWWALWAPHTLRVKAIVAKQGPALAGPVWGRFTRALTHINRGQPREALRVIEDSPPGERYRSWLAYLLYLSDLPVSQDWIREALSVDRVEDPPLEHVFTSGAYAADRAQWEDHARAIEMATTKARQLATGADSSLGRRWNAVARALVGYGEWKRGASDVALGHFTEARPDLLAVPIGLSMFVRAWTGALYEEQGEIDEAIRYFESLWSYGWDLTYRYLRLGRLYEQVGQLDRARASYESFLVAWADADEGLPEVVEARAALDRLSRMAN